MDRPIASDLSQQVLELRRLRGELSAPELDSSNRTLYPIPCAVVQRESFAAVSEAEWTLKRQARRLQG